MFPLGKLRRDVEWQEARLLGDRRLISERVTALKSSFGRKLRSPLTLAVTAALGFGVGLLRRRPATPRSHGKLGPAMRDMWHTADKITRLLAGTALAPLFWGKIGAVLASRPPTEQHAQ